jgi:hypothetical protein
LQHQAIFIFILGSLKQHQHIDKWMKALVSGVYRIIFRVKKEAIAQTEKPEIDEAKCL